ncbi:MAG TPA: BTAD domain-containing putative transcriptional regulator [Anaerolineales bacterium]|nr:BTAD domain-containing putative transcriptional regulator [Anaerolineales bacterium]
MPRQRLNQMLLEALDYRLTLLLAGAGYGKSTALSVLAEQFKPLIWYQLTNEDSDTLVFLLHLCHATQHAIPGLKSLPTPYLEAWDVSHTALPWTWVIDQYINALSEKLNRPTILVLDDTPIATETTEIAHILDRLIGLAPPNLHIILAGRPPLSLPNLSRWRLRGEVLTIDQAALAFNADEINLLFGGHYGYKLTSEEVDALLDYTEGWAIALQLIWQNLRSESSTSIKDALSRQRTIASKGITSSSPDQLFEILAYEVFERQPIDIQDFLLVSSTLREMTPEACDALISTPERPSHNSAAMLAYLRRQELFVVEQSDGTLRYHKVFHDFLRQQAAPTKQLDWHARAAAYYKSQENTGAAIYHLLQGQAWDQAATLLDSFGEQLLASGRLDTLAVYLDALPPTILPQHPSLLFYLGDLARLGSRFQEALGWYQQSETIWRAQGYLDGIGRALRGQARVYLDTVDPSQAEKVLEQAIRLSDGIESRDSQARLYDLLAENKLNAGRPEEAERLRQQAAALRDEGPSDSQLVYRVLLRTGRLEEARRGLEERTQTERSQPVHTPRAHRETLLLLSLVDSFQGRVERAYHTALEGTLRGTTLDSLFITAVGHMRQGHALTLPVPSKPLSTPERYELARQQFERSIELSRSLAVPRLRVEADWGLCRVFGYQGDLNQALKVAQEGIEIATQAGDEWVASMVRLTMGASLILAARYEAAEEWLGKAARSFHECGDPFGRCAARLWLCLGLYHQNSVIRLEQILPDVLAACREGEYDFLFTRPTLLGPPQVRSLTPLLILARDKGWESNYAARMLETLGLGGVTLHPGYQLRVHTLGTFKVWRGEDQVPRNSWNREKARQLFQILLTYRRGPLSRDQIAEALWPDLDPTTSHRNFRNVLNALYHVLEPDREPGSESAYVMREGSTYALRPTADLWLDAEVFLDTLHQAEMLIDDSPDEAISLLTDAIDLYQGEYLPDARYESWTAAERERLAVLFLQNADRLSDLLLEKGRYEEAIHVNQRILAQDNCWERAYRHLMLAYDRLGDRGQVGRIYQRCVHTLRAEIDVIPSPETDALYQELTLKQ